VSQRHTSTTNLAGAPGMAKQMRSDRVRAPIYTAKKCLLQVQIPMVHIISTNIPLICISISSAFPSLMAYKRSLFPFTCFDDLPEHFRTQRQWLPHPRRSLRMVPQLIVRIGMNKRRQWTPVDHQPRNESSKLLWSEEIHLKHAYWMRAQRLIPDFVDA